MDYSNVVRQTIAWNSARYDRVYSKELTMSLLVEEGTELQDSQSLTDVLDACGDITFVCIGALWKLGFDESEIENLILKSNLSGRPVEEVKNILTDNVINLLYSPKLRAIDNKLKLQEEASIIVGYLYAVLAQLDRINMQHEFLPILKVIANSNDTKEIRSKTHYTVKANIQKGSNFVPPTAGLKKLLQQNRSIH